MCQCGLSTTYAQVVVIPALARTPAGTVIACPSVAQAGPKCQQIQRERWSGGSRQEKRSCFQQLISMPACRNAGTTARRHVVFTLPEALNKLCLYEPAKVYKLLFDTAWSVIRDFAHDEKHLGAETGMISILHTWGQNLSLHPHLHCIVPGGGLTKSGFWKRARCDGKFLFPVKAMSRVFRARFVNGLRSKIIGLDRSLYQDLFKTQWVVYAKRPFGGPKQVVEYLGRYA
ncbi:MAG: transposase [Cyclobacteriaceae bacterium]